MTDPMHQLLGKMQALMGKHRDAPVMYETEPAASTHQVSRENPFPVLTDIVQRGETPAEVAPVVQQPEPDFTAATITSAEANIRGAFTSLGQPKLFAATDVTPVLTDIVWRGEVQAEVSPDAPQPAPDAPANTTPAEDADNVSAGLAGIEPIEPFAAAIATPALTDLAEHHEVLAEVSPDAPQPAAPDIPTEIVHSAETADSIPKAFTSPEQAELLATAVATHVLGMIDGHLVHQVNTVMAQRLRRVVDDTLSTLLTQLALDIESIVRDAVAEELARHGIPPANPPENPPNPV